MFFTEIIFWSWLHYYFCKIAVYYKKYISWKVIFVSFNDSNITDKDAIKIGSDDAPLKIVEYINLRCPDSKAYEENVAPFLNNYIENGTVQRILKHFDKHSIYLELGNVMNQYLDYSTPVETYQTIQKLFSEQNDWGTERLTDIPHIAADYGLSLQDKNRNQAHNVTAEVKAVNVERIPTVFVGDEAFVETIDLDNFKNAVEKHFL